MEAQLEKIGRDSGVNIDSLFSFSKVPRVQEEIIRNNWRKLGWDSGVNIDFLYFVFFFWVRIVTVHRKNLDKEKNSMLPLQSLILNSFLQLRWEWTWHKSSFKNLSGLSKWLTLVWETIVAWNAFLLWVRYVHIVAD